MISSQKNQVLGQPGVVIVRADTTTNGRYANQFIRAMAAHFISENLGAKPIYPPINLDKLGITLYQPSTNHQATIDKQKMGESAPVNIINVINMEETVFLDYTNKQLRESFINAIPHNTLLDLNSIYCQTPEHALKINEFLRLPENQDRIKLANPNRERYERNNDVFIHVRLGDVPFHNPGFAYYDQVLAGLEFETGYITSDTISHPICRALIHKYKLQVINQHLGIEDILQFGSSCKYIILSAGTFSWLIGVLGFHSQIYYPDPALKRRWHGNIFECMPGWNKIGY